MLGCQAFKSLAGCTAGCEQSTSRWCFGWLQNKAFIYLRSGSSPGVHRASGRVTAGDHSPGKAPTYLPNEVVLQKPCLFWLLFSCIQYFLCLHTASPVRLFYHESCCCTSTLANSKALCKASGANKNALFFHTRVSHCLCAE